MSRFGFGKLLAFVMGFGLVLSCAHLSRARAADDISSVPDWYDPTDMQAYREDLASLPLPAERTQSCSETYTRLFKNESFEIRVFFGYTNDESAPGHKADDAVYDHYTKEAFVDLLKKPCDGTLAACGFSGDSEVLTKEITALDGKSRTIRITLEASAVSDSAKENQHQLKHEQKSQTSQIQRDFSESIRDADMILYVGHARHGSGPGFKPLPTLSWSWIDAGLFKPSWHKMLAALRSSQTKPSIIGIYACLSDKYYRKGLTKAAPNSGLILSDGDLEYDDAQQAVFATLNSVLRMDCQQSFDQSMKHTKLTDLFD